MMFLLFSMAFAVDPTLLPRAAPLDLPEKGVVLLRPTPDIVGAAPVDLPRSLVLQDATGRDVPYAILLTPGEEETMEPLSYRPVAERTWETWPNERPVDALVLQMDDLPGDGPYRVSVQRFLGDQWLPIGEPTLIYEVQVASPDGDSETLSRRDVPIPHLPGPFRLTILGGRDPDLFSVSGRRSLPGDVPPLRERVEVGAPVITEEGKARYSVTLPGPREVRSLRIETTEDVYDRGVTIGTVEDPQRTHARIRRISLAETRVDHNVLRDLRLSADRLVVEVDTDRGRPLPITGLLVESVGAAILVRDAGPAPQTLYAGAGPIADPHDLGIARAELFTLAPREVSVGPLGANASYLPAATREGVDGPGPVTTLSRYRFVRAVEGAAGWVEVVLDPSVLARAATERADLRVLDGEDRQIPFLLVELPDEDPFALGALERREEGRYSLIRVPVEGADTPIARVTLTTDQGVFRREVEVLRDRGSVTETLRRVVWEGEVQGQALGLSLGEAMGRELLVRIDNGDNPPLPILRITASTTRVALRFRLPEGGARLVYGARGQEAPSYDLSLLREETLRGVVGTATLGPETALTPPAIALSERLAVYAAIAFLGLGLVGMAVRVATGKVPETA